MKDELPGLSRPLLTVDLGAIAANWKALAEIASPAEASAVVKADAYGLGLDKVAPALAAAGAKTFFVAQPPEGAALRRILGPEPAIYVFNGFTPYDLEVYASNDLRPVLNSLDQIRALQAALYAFEGVPKVGLHIESGINRLGLTTVNLQELKAAGLSGIEVTLIMSHLACADAPEEEMNPRQRAAFDERSALLKDIAPNAQRALSATGGILLGPEYHFDLVRPGIGLYGAMPFADARRVATLEAPILQLRDVAIGETVGYGASWTATRPSRIGVLPLGYADGFFRTLSGTAMQVFHKGVAAPVVGRVSMDMITVDFTDVPEAAAGDMVEVFGPHQSVDEIAAHIGTIGYEVLTALGGRYARRYIEAD